MEKQQFTKKTPKYKTYQLEHQSFRKLLKSPRLPGNKEKLKMSVMASQGWYLPQGRQRENGSSPLLSLYLSGGWYSVKGWSLWRDFAFSWAEDSQAKPLGWCDSEPSGLGQALLVGWGHHAVTSGEGTSPRPCLCPALDSRQ